MGDRQFEEALVENISQAKQMLEELPEFLRTRTVSLKAYPNEVISRIQQIDGVLIEFQEKI